MVSTPLQAGGSGELGGAVHKVQVLHLELLEQNQVMSAATYECRNTLFFLTALDANLNKIWSTSVAEQAATHAAQPQTQQHKHNVHAAVAVAVPLYSMMKQVGCRKMLCRAANVGGL